MYPIGITRLVQLADHLKYGKLGHKVFDFSRFNSYCGTLGCAIGECPTLFPDEWEFNASRMPVLCGYTDTPKSFERFFNFGSFGDDYPPLFAPSARKGDSGYGRTRYLPVTATKEQVADNILAYVKWKCEQLGLPVLTTLKQSAPIIPVFSSLMKKGEAELHYRLVRDLKMVNAKETVCETN